jgi:hypothetical protein
MGAKADSGFTVRPWMPIPKPVQKNRHPPTPTSHLVAGRWRAEVKQEVCQR